MTYRRDIGAGVYKSHRKFGDISNPGIGCFLCHTPTASDLLDAITAHASTDNQNEQGDGGGAKDFGGGRYPPSEANAVIRKFNALSAADKQAILDFLRAL